MEKQPDKFKLGDICIDADGTWWVQWFGYHAQQGGHVLGSGNMGSTDIESLMKIIGRKLNECTDVYLAEIAKRTTADEVSVHVDS